MTKGILARGNWEVDIYLRLDVMILVNNTLPNTANNNDNSNFNYNANVVKKLDKKKKHLIQFT